MRTVGLCVYGITMTPESSRFLIQIFKTVLLLYHALYDDDDDQYISQTIA
jgi:hypothetical protein